MINSDWMETLSYTKKSPAIFCYSGGSIPCVYAAIMNIARKCHKTEPKFVYHVGNRVNGKCNKDKISALSIYLLLVSVFELIFCCFWYSMGELQAWTINIPSIFQQSKRFGLIHLLMSNAFRTKLAFPIVYPAFNFVG